MKLTDITAYDAYEVEATLEYNLSTGFEEPTGRLEVTVSEARSNSSTVYRQTQGSCLKDYDYLSGILKHQTEFHHFGIEYKVTSNLGKDDDRTKRYTVQIDPKTAKITGKKIK